jgi:four helix bundle protein
MSGVKNFEDLRCWQSARELCRLIYTFTRKEKFSRDYTLVNQIRNSSGSGMDNMSEGFDRAGNKEFIQFLAVSRGSIAETKSQIYRALDQNYIDNNEFHQAYDLANQTSKEITSLMVYLKNSDKKGFKFS